MRSLLFIISKKIKSSLGIDCHCSTLINFNHSKDEDNTETSILNPDTEMHNDIQNYLQMSLCD